MVEDIHKWLVLRLYPCIQNEWMKDRNGELVDADTNAAAAVVHNTRSHTQSNCRLEYIAMIPGVHTHLSVSVRHSWRLVDTAVHIYIYI